MASFALMKNNIRPTRRTVLAAGAGLMALPARAASGGIRTVAGIGVQGFAGDGESVKTAKIDQPYGVLIGPDGDLYWADFGSNRVLKLSGGKVIAVAGNGMKGHEGDGGDAKQAVLNAPHEVRFDSKRNMFIAERDANVVRFVEKKTGQISTLVGTGAPGFGGDDGAVANHRGAAQAAARASCWIPTTISLSATSRTTGCAGATPRPEC